MYKLRKVETFYVNMQRLRGPIIPFGRPVYSSNAVLSILSNVRTNK